MGVATCGVIWDDLRCFLAVVRYIRPLGDAVFNETIWVFLRKNLIGKPK